MSTRRHFPGYTYQEYSTFLFRTWAATGFKKTFFFKDSEIEGEMSLSPLFSEVFRKTLEHTRQFPHLHRGIP